MAGQEIDRLGDPSATDEERQLGKRRLIKGPKEFRDLQQTHEGLSRKRRKEMTDKFEIDVNYRPAARTL